MCLSRMDSLDLESTGFDEVAGMDDSDLFELLDDMDDSLAVKDDDDQNWCIICETSDKTVEDGEKGVVVCTGCGNVLHNILDSNPEWNNYGEDCGSSRRCTGSTNFFLPQSSLGTTIGGYGKNKIKTLHSWSAMPYKERSLHIVLKEIQFRCRKANILKCIEDDAKIFYYNINECKHVKGKNKGKTIIIRGRNRSSLIGACVYYACKRKGNTRSPKEIADIFDLDYTDITKGCKTFVRLMKIRKMECKFDSSTPEQFVPRFCRALKIKGAYVDECIKIAKNINKLNLASMHTPLSVATGSIMIVAEFRGINITKKQMAKEFSVSEVTIAKAFKRMEPYKKILANDELVDKIIDMLDRERENAKLPAHLQKRYDRIKNKDDGLDSDDSISDVSDEYDSPKDYPLFDPDTEDIDSYINSTSVDLYDKIAYTEEIYSDIDISV